MDSNHTEASFPPNSMVVTSQSLRYLDPEIGNFCMTLAHVHGVRKLNDQHHTKFVVHQLIKGIKLVSLTTRQTYY